MPASRSRANAARRTPPSPPSADSAPGGEFPKNVLKAVKDGRLGTVRSWLNEGGKADTLFDAEGEGGGIKVPCTLLMLAAQNGHMQIVELLLKRGADINLQNSGGLAALNAAAYHGRERMVDVLLQHGAELNPQDAAWPVLEAAAQGGKERVVDLLLRRGAEINLQVRRLLQPPRRRAPPAAGGRRHDVARCGRLFGAAVGQGEGPRRVRPGLQNASRGGGSGPEKGAVSRSRRRR